MANKQMKIHIAADANLAALREVNNELAKMAMQVGRKNDDARQAIMEEAREFINLGNATEHAASRAVLSARQIEEAWKKAMAKPAEGVESAAKGFGRLNEVAKGALKGIGGTFGKLGEMLVQGTVWGALAAVIAKAFSFAWDKIQEDAERAAKRVETKFGKSLDSIKEGAAAVEASFSNSMAGIDRSISKFDAMTNSVRELTKAEIELAKQHAIANGMDAASANAAATDLSAQVDFEAEEARLKNVIEMEKKRVAAAKEAEAKTAEEVKRATAAKAAAEEDYQKKRADYIEKNAKKEHAGAMMQSSAGAFYMPGVSAEEAARSRADAALDFEASDEGKKAADKVRQLKDVLNGIKTGDKAAQTAADATAKIEGAQRALDTLAARREARELAVQNELAEKANEEAKTREAAEKRLADERMNAERAAAAERARLDAQESARRERERQAELAAKIKDHQALLAAERAEESKTRAAVSAAESKLQRAWGWYRDKDSMAAQLAEEKADASARRQFARDFDRLKSKRRDWRTAENLSVDDEAVRRVAVAQEEKQAAERHLAEIEKNTADLAAKIDELLQVKG